MFACIRSRQIVTTNEKLSFQPLFEHDVMYRARRKTLLSYCEIFQCVAVNVVSDLINVCSTMVWMVLDFFLESVKANMWRCFLCLIVCVVSTSAGDCLENSFLKLTLLYV